MRRDVVESIIDGLLDPDVEHVEHAPGPSYALVTGNFARGQALRGHTVLVSFGPRVGTFATGQRDPNKKIKVIR